MQSLYPKDWDGKTPGPVFNLANFKWQDGFVRFSDIVDFAKTTTFNSFSQLQAFGQGIVTTSLNKLTDNDIEMLEEKDGVSLASVGENIPSFVKNTLIILQDLINRTLHITSTSNTTRIDNFLEIEKGIVSESLATTSLAIDKLQSNSITANEKISSKIVYSTVIVSPSLCGIHLYVNQFHFPLIQSGSNLIPESPSSIHVTVFPRYRIEFYDQSSNLIAFFDNKTDQVWYYLEVPLSIVEWKIFLNGKYI